MDSNKTGVYIPDSVLPFPEHWYDRSKYLFWKMIAPLHNIVRDVLLSVGFLKHDFRQDFPIGYIAPGKTMSEFVRFLVDTRWYNHFIAWYDNEQVLSVRKPVDFEWQYHLRIFSDGEVRGHYEYTPESHPIWHANEVRMTQCKEDFLKFLGDWVVAGPAVHED